MTIYCGVDFHVRQQTICFCDTAGGELHFQELRHDRDDIRGFYSQFTGEVVVGLEASGYSTWFVELLEGLGHHVLVGDAAETRRRAKRRQKNDRREAELILDLLRKAEFP
jgi:transposase